MSPLKVGPQVGQADLSKAGDPEVKPIPQVNTAAVLNEQASDQKPPTTSVSPLIEQLRKKLAAQGPGVRTSPVTPPAVRTGVAGNQANVPDTRVPLKMNKIGRKPYRKPDGTWDMQLPYDLPNGDLVVYEVMPPGNTPTHVMDRAEIILSRHNLRIIKQMDPAQVYPFLTDCSCGTQARTFTLDDAKLAADRHLEAKIKAASPK